ncbi:hypothetical protein PR048_021526 [Dryococelus australis]|uniref:Uncharacterized protein n=1 Tax=Dryococelus australis TaxID=614101 RepID=A0ABQ9GYF9_9NEOP|nr:hypothetical protein PR048_021526 [Dryococelus australis]
MYGAGLQRRACTSSGTTLECKLVHPQFGTFILERPAGACAFNYPQHRFVRRYPIRPGRWNPMFNSAELKGNDFNVRPPCSALQSCSRHKLVSFKRGLAPCMQRRTGRKRIELSCRNPLCGGHDEREHKLRGSRLFSPRSSHCDTGDNNTRIQRSIAQTRKPRNLRAVLPSLRSPVQTGTTNPQLEDTTQTPNTLGHRLFTFQVVCATTQFPCRRRIERMHWFGGGGGGKHFACFPEGVVTRLRRMCLMPARDRCLIAAETHQSRKWDGPPWEPRDQGREARERYGRHQHARLVPHRSYAQDVQCFRLDEVDIEKSWNVSAGVTGDPRENPPTSDIVRHDSRMRESGNDPAGN